MPARKMYHYSGHFGGHLGNPVRIHSHSNLSEPVNLKLMRYAWKMTK